MKTINIASEQNINVINEFKDILNTDYIFIPIKDESKIKIKLNSHVLKEELVYQDFNIKRYSSISGKFINIMEFNNEKFIVIKNDYKELSNNTRARNLENITKDKFLKLIENTSLYDIFTKNINTLYINGIDEDPLTFNKYRYLKDSIKDISSIINLISKLFNIKQIKIVIKNSYSELLKDYKVSVSYHKIEDIYPLGNPIILRKYLIKDQNSYLIDLNDILNLVYIIKKNKIRLEKYITINGNNIKNPSVINVKKYSYLNNLLTNFDLINKRYDVIINNSLCGDIVDPKNIVISNNINSIIINSRVKEKELECSMCSLCYNVCPMKINPLEKNNKCIKCGLCSYVCPSKINVYERNQKDE